VGAQRCRHVLGVGSPVVTLAVGQQRVQGVKGHCAAQGKTLHGGNVVLCMGLLAVSTV